MNEKTTHFRRTLCWAVLAVGLYACTPAAQVKSPLPRIRQQLAEYPEAVLVLEDMRTTGNFVKGYEHKYKAIVGEKQPDSEELAFRQVPHPWRPVPKSLYEQYSPYLGMAVLAKKADGEMEEAFFPPVYHFAGNPRYGHWTRNEQGHSVWRFVGTALVLAATLNIVGNVTASGYNSYRNQRRSRRPYYGPNNAYGTRGSYTQRTHRSFYERQQTRQASKQRGFNDRVRSRSRMSGGRSRSSSSRGGK